MSAGVDAFFAEKLREARENSGFSQERVAKAIGVSPELLARWESGERVPSALYLDQLARLYGVDSESLFGDGPLVYSSRLRDLLKHEPSKTLSPEAILELSEWLSFLDDYGELLKEEGVEPTQTLVFLLENAPTDLETFEGVSEANGVLAYKGFIPIEDGIYSVAYFHPQVGFSLFANLSYVQQAPLGLERYPRSVLQKVRKAVEEGRLSVSGAAGLLRVDSATIERELLS
jgi:transcriptional regulator with XRE-family HTH domain